MARGVRRSSARGEPTPLLSLVPGVIESTNTTLPQPDTGVNLDRSIDRNTVRVLGEQRKKNIGVRKRVRDSQEEEPKWENQRWKKSSTNLGLTNTSPQQTTYRLTRSVNLIICWLKGKDDGTPNHVTVSYQNCDRATEVRGRREGNVRWRTLSEVKRWRSGTGGGSTDLEEWGITPNH